MDWTAHERDSKFITTSLVSQLYTFTLEMQWLEHIWRTNRENSYHSSSNIVYQEEVLHVQNASRKSTVGQKYSKGNASCPLAII